MKLTEDFEHQIWHLLKLHELQNKESYLLAISGGLDSMVLLEIFSKLRPQAKLRVAHYHHGDEGAQKVFRDQALKLVQEKALNLPNAEFIFEKSKVVLRTENEMRNARWSFLRKHRVLNEPILTAHHQDDWAETLTLKLIRGVGEEGFLSFQVWNHEILRPFLNQNKTVLQAYAEARNIKWVEDPSNQSEDYLRNWLRKSWFQELENKIPGAYHNYSKSLFQLVEALSEDARFELQFYKNNADNGLDRAWYLGLSSQNQLKALALFFKKSGVHEFTRGQLEEIKKRLDKNQNELTFEIIRKWVINATQIMLE